MSRKYLLVDFENVQPSHLGGLKPGEWEIRIFHGQHQIKMELSLASALQPFGAHVKYVKIAGAGKNALDFYIAYYIGRLSVEQPGASFVVVSRDTGFDPLIKHLVEKGVACERVVAVPGGPSKSAAAKQPAMAKPAPATKVAKVAKAAKAPAAKAPAKRAAKKNAAPPRLQEVIDRLAGSKKARPGTLKTLRSWLGNFKPPFADAELDAMLQALQHAGVLTLQGNRIAYAA